VQAELEVSGASLSKGRHRLLLQECTESERLNTLRVVEGRAREVCAKSLKESELTSSGEIVPS
jgi:hypothetical protein